MRCLAFFLVFIAVPAFSGTISGRVGRITDGDSLVLIDDAHQPHKIRLSAIDAPELLQDFGQAAKTSLSALAFNQLATAECNVRDQRQNELCRVIINGKDIGLEQVRLGMAWWDDAHAVPQTAQERADFQQAEFNAKIRRLGLWNSKNPTPPWEWRHGAMDE